MYDHGLNRMHIYTKDVTLHLNQSYSEILSEHNQQVVPVLAHYCQAALTGLKDVH